jgi:uncharacterized membrane protein
LFIGLAKLIPFDSFHALQAISFVASLCVFPAAYVLARELRASHFVALAAGLLLAFMPNVWFYGGTALSDVPSMVLSLIATALLLRMEGGRLARPGGRTAALLMPDSRSASLPAFARRTC